MSFINGKAMPDPFEYTMASGLTYRLRIYGISVEYGFRLHRANHKLKVIAVDGSFVNPAAVECLDLYSGERYDVLVEAIQPDGIYELRARAIDYQGNLMEEFTSAHFKYEGAVGGSATVTADVVMADEFDTSTFSLLDPYALTAYSDNHSGFSGSYEPLEGPKEVLSDALVYKTTSYAVEGEEQFAFMDT
mmetsp:Transcript_46886/g.69717  ORF Transcript_46886/g.69717 Transcript_46886/m.69717 type:complete len:190 (-) Transcript_46886:822-1391(-)